MTQQRTKVKNASLNGTRPAAAEADETPVSLAELASLSRDELLAMLLERAEPGVRIAFAGKDNARRIARKVRPRLERAISKYSSGPPTEQARNLVVEGDNLQAMVTLYRERGQVDLIVADPPYNTGNDFRYNDRWEDDPNDPGLGEFVSADDTARHTKWMRFMFPRLQMMKSMLRPGGVLAICIDHRELFHLGQMLDELFGDKNRIAIINWQRSYTRTNDASHVATTTEYVLVYTRSVEKANTGATPRDREASSNPDSDPRPWSDTPATASDARAHKAMVYAVQSPFTGTLFYPPVGSHWRHGQAQNLTALKAWGCRFELRSLDDQETRAKIIGVPTYEVPSAEAIVLAEPFEDACKKATRTLERRPWPKFFFLKRGLGRPRLKKYLSDMKQVDVPTTFWATEDFATYDGSVSWPHSESGHTQQGVDELTAIVGAGHEFKTVKPLKLFQKLIELWCPADGLVLDPFAGSGTTGHAVLLLNQHRSASRRFILIEQGRPERGDSYARSLLADRLKRVISGKWKNGKGSPLAGGYRFVTLEKKVDADALLRMERDEMVDTVIASYWDSNRRRGSSLITVERPESFRYLAARNNDDEGFYLVWDGPSRNTDFTEDVYETVAREARKAGLKNTYHVYARFNLYQTDNVRFYQIPDRILADFGLDLRSEPFNEDDG